MVSRLLHLGGSRKAQAGHACYASVSARLAFLVFRLYVICRFSCSIVQTQQLRCHRASSNYGDVWYTARGTNTGKLFDNIAAGSARRTQPKVHMLGVASLLLHVLPCDGASVIDVSASHCAPALEGVQVRADVLHGLAAAVIIAAHQQAVHLQHGQAQTRHMLQHFNHDLQPDPRSRSLQAAVPSLEVRCV